MCEPGSEVLLEVTIPAHLSHTGIERKAEKGIDACIADIVKALNSGGVVTIGSCCGHGKSDGSILLMDGREMAIKTGEHHECAGEKGNEAGRNQGNA